MLFGVLALSSCTKRFGGGEREGGGSARMGDREIEENRRVVNDEAEVGPHAVGFTSFEPRGETRGLEEGVEKGKDIVMTTSD